MDLQCILCIANSSYTVKTPKDEVTWDTYWNFYKKLDIFTSKREISRSNGRTGDKLSKQESPIQNGRVGTFGWLFLQNTLSQIFDSVLSSHCEVFYKNRFFFIKHSSFHSGYPQYGSISMVKIHENNNEWVRF